MWRLPKVLITVAILGLLAAISVMTSHRRFPPEPPPLLAATLNLPYTFGSGGVIYASQMNANFQAIRSTINALDDQNIANASITGSLKLIDGTVNTAKLGSDSVTSSKILDGTIATADIADGAIVGAKIPTGAITGAMILDGTITNADHADGSISEAKLDINSAPPLSNRLVIWNSSAGKLDYGGNAPSSATCVQILVAHGTHSTSSGLKKTYGSFIDPTQGETTADTTPLPFRNPTPLTFHHLLVESSGVWDRDVTFKLRIPGLSTIPNPTCTITTGTTTCSDTTNNFGDPSVDKFVLEVSSTDGGSSRTYNATICTSPF